MAKYRESVIVRNLAIATCLVLSMACCGCSSNKGEVQDNPQAVSVVADQQASEDPSDGDTSQLEEDESRQIDEEGSVAPTDEGAAGQDDVTESSQNMFTGTCRILSTSEVLELQNDSTDGSAYGAAPENRYALIVADHPQSIYAHFAGDADDMIERERDLVCVSIEGTKAEGDVSWWEQYDGMQVTVYLDPDTTWFPSDARLPVGVPHTHTAVLVSAD